MTQTHIALRRRDPILRAAEFKLRRGGYEVEIASDGEEAWEAILGRKPDILVTDCQMPRLDGFGADSAGARETRPPPIARPDAHRQGLRAGHDELAAKWSVLAVIAKPFSPRELLQR